MQHLVIDDFDSAAASVGADFNGNLRSLRYRLLGYAQRRKNKHSPGDSIRPCRLHATFRGATVGKDRRTPLAQRPCRDIPSEWEEVLMHLASGCLDSSGDEPERFRAQEFFVVSACL